MVYDFHDIKVSEKADAINCLGCSLNLLQIINRGKLALDSALFIPLGQLQFCYIEIVGYLVEAVQRSVSILWILKDRMDNILGSKWLLAQLNRLGYCLSYKEVQCYKQSNVNKKRPESFMATVRNETFSRSSANNVDHNVRTLAMGMIASTAGGNMKLTKNELPATAWEQTLL